MKKFLIAVTMAFLLGGCFTALAHAQVSNCSATITTQDQWDDCCDNAGASNQAPQSACDAFETSANSTCSAAISNQVQYDDCCDNGGGTGQASASSCNTYENANGMTPGQDGSTSASTNTPSSAAAAAANNSSSTNAATNQSLNIHITNPLAGKATTIGDAINLFLSVIIRIALPLIILFFIWSGLTFIFARGNPTEIGKAKQMFLYTVIGTLLILGAWVITNALIGTINSIIT